VAARNPTTTRVEHGCLARLKPAAFSFSGSSGSGRIESIRDESSEARR
jgi:hypothetical protein